MYLGVDLDKFLTFFQHDIKKTIVIEFTDTSLSQLLLMRIALQMCALMA